MPRKPQYSLTEVFEKAIPVVLAQGFRGCPMETLIAKTGFNRRAFYLEFASKKGFMEVLLGYYIEHKLLPLQEQLVNAENHPQAIIQFFEDYQRQIDHQGCLLVRLILELGNEDEQVRHQARTYYDSLQSSFIACLENAVAHQQLPPNTNIEPLALKLSCFAQGFAVSNNIQQGQSDVLIVIQSLFVDNP
jgi:TetR/AcrR family transcriptional repressor of nem operon